MITEQRASTGRNVRAGGHAQLKVSRKVEHAESRSLTGSPAPIVQLHIAEERHDLLIGPSDRKSILGHIAQKRDTAGLADDCLSLREPMTQNQAANAVTTRTARMIHSVGLRETSTSESIQEVSSGRPSTSTRR